MANKTVYIFYYNTYQIVDHDDDGTLYENVRENLGAFFDYKTGLEYYKHKYPTRNIEFETITVMDGE